MHQLAPISATGHRGGQDARVREDVKMKTRMFAVLAGSLLAPVAAQAGEYVFTQIDYPGASQTQVFGVNNRGEVAGIGLGTVVSPFTYKWEEGTFTDVPPVADDRATYVLGINDAHVLVGSAFSTDGTVQSGVVRRTDGTYTLFDHPDAVTITQARGINDQGMVAGYHDRADGTTIGFVYRPGTGNFLDIVPSTMTLAHGINVAGEIVGSAQLNQGEACPRAPADSYGWVRRTNAEIHFFRVNGLFTQARGINDRGVIAGTVLDDAGIRRGYTARIVGPEPCQAVVVPPARLIQFPGWDATIPEGITNTGVIVGIVYNNIDGIQHGFVAVPQ